MLHKRPVAAGQSISIEGVSKRFGATRALQDLDLQINPGEFVTLLGPSGCGKTTTLRLISGFERPDVGVVSIGGQDVTNVPPNRRDVHTVFQGYALFPHLTVAENVDYALKVRRISGAERRKKVGEMLERVGLSDKAADYPKVLSGGQMQRVALARALIAEPPILLLDEPLSALDRRLRKSMQMELRRLHAEQGITFVCVTHDQEEAMVMSDRIAILNGGVLVQMDTPGAIFGRPASRFVVEFMGGGNFLRGKLDIHGTLSPCTDTRAGQSVLVSVWPHALHLGPLPDTAVGLIAKAVVRDIVNTGAGFRVDMSLEDGTALLAEIAPGAIPDPVPVPGSACIVWAARNDLIVIEEKAS